MESSVFSRFQEISPITFITVGLIAFAMNLLYVYEVQKINERKVLKAGLASLTSYILAFIGVSACMDNPLNIIAGAAGTFTGTFVMTEIPEIKQAELHHLMDKRGCVVK